MHFCTFFKKPMYQFCNCCIKCEAHWKIVFVVVRIIVIHTVSRFSRFLCSCFTASNSVYSVKRFSFWESQHESFNSTVKSEKKPNLLNKQWQILLWCIICILMTDKSLIIFPNPRSTDIKPTELRNKSFFASFMYECQQNVLQQNSQCLHFSRQFALFSCWSIFCLFLFTDAAYGWVKGSALKDPNLHAFLKTSSDQGQGLISCQSLNLNQSRSLTLNCWSVYSLIRCISASLNSPWNKRL